MTSLYEVGQLALPGSVTACAAIAMFVAADYVELQHGRRALRRLLIVMAYLITVLSIGLMAIRFDLLRT